VIGFLSLRRHIAALLALLSVVSVLAVVHPPRAEAHRYSSAFAASILENAYRSHCGNGASWVCITFPSFETYTPNGEHSWNIELHWTERGAYGLGTVRGCGVIARIEHDKIAQYYRTEWCW
jgi:hypothetical protein